MTVIRQALVSSLSLATLVFGVAPVLSAQPSAIREAQAAVREAQRAVLDGDRRDGRYDPRDVRIDPRDRRSDARVLFTWSGRVDREARITMRGRDITIRGDADRSRRDSRPRANGALPRTDGDVWVRVTEGRGNVDVIQQPNARNNYTTVVRIRDARGGNDRYQLTAFWAPDDRGGWGRDDDRGRGNGNGKARGRDDDRGRDNDWPRGRDDDRGRDRDDGWYGNDRNRSGLRWSGIVDDVVELRIQGRRVEVIERSGARTRDVRTDFGNQGLPRQNATVRLQRADGRGSVAVVQQPAVWNGFTAVVRIRDERGGADRYDLDLVW